MGISSGKEVSIEYTLKLDDQTVVDTNVGTQPLTYTHGSSQIIPGLERGMEGMEVGESRQVTVSPEEGYGPVNDQAFVEVGRQHIPEDAVKAGAHVKGKDSQGKDFIARVSEIRDETVVLDLNHPLAGKTLFFDIRIVDIR